MFPMPEPKEKFSCDGAYKMGLDSQGKFISEWIPLFLNEKRKEVIKR